MKILRNLLLVLAFVPLLLVSCDSLDKENEKDIPYTFGFESLQSGGIEGLSDMKLIEDTYKESLGVKDELLILHGTIEECDAKVINSCKTAEKKLDRRPWSGQYTFKVTNALSEKVVYTKSFGK